MLDISPFIAPKSDQLNADDLISGSKTIAITNVESIQGDQPIAIYFEGDSGKPYKPCKSMLRVMLAVWGKDGKGYIGRSMTLYCDPSVMFAGVAVGGIRISHMSHISKSQTILLTATRSKRKPFHVKPLVNPTQPPEPAKQEMTDAQASLFEAGMEAAQKGMESYKLWFLGLSQVQKEWLSKTGRHQKLKDGASKRDNQQDDANQPVEF